MSSSLQSKHDQADACVVVGRASLCIEDIVRLARGECEAALDADPTYRSQLRAAQNWVAQHQQAEGEIYGVTTGVGASVENHIPETLRTEMPLNLLRFHGVGSGEILGEAEAAACVAARLASLARGYSGVRAELLERLCELLNQRLLPQIPAEGSVGASGDLTPLSYLASTLVGEREVTLRGEVMTAADGHRALGLEPLALLPKESLSVMNGTSVMTGLACLAFSRASALAALASSLTAMTSEAIHGNPEHFDDRIFALKPHPGSRRCAAWIREHLESGASLSVTRPVARLQDRYSVRCAPHVIGVLLDALTFSRDMLEIEINGVNDNPLVDAEAGEILHGGNFYGGHVCFVMDSLKNTVASVADLLDRQLTLLCCRDTSAGLPDNLVAGQGLDRVVHHGFKAMQISASALTAEALKLTSPASAFSRSTESHNQDKVSMGTIAARDCLRVLELTETVAAIVLLADCQAVDLRDQPDTLGKSHELHTAVRSEIPMVEHDRRQDLDIQRVLAMHRAGALPGVASVTRSPESNEGGEDPIRT
jgi:histidine ammonia-lyase